MVQASLPPYTQALPAMPDHLMLQATVQGLKMCFAQDLAEFWDDDRECCCWLHG